MPANKSKFVPEEIHFRYFQILKGLIDIPWGFDEEKVTDHSFTVNLDVSFNLEENYVKSDFSVSINTESKNEEEAKGEFDFVFLFEVDNLDELATPEGEEELVVDAGLSNAIASICYSTSRGILMTRFNGTAFDKFILPIIDPNELLKF